MIDLSYPGGRPRVALPTLSDEQSAALVSDREVAVTAGAGAGKTTTLAGRFVMLHDRLLDEGGHTDPAAVLVVTFTERAAQEMRERCYAMVAAVARRLATAGGDTPQVRRLRAGWESLRDRFASAAISTFHGFCARVVREHPAETGVVPAFTILDEGDAAALGLAAAGAAVDAELATPGPTGPLLLRTFGGRARLVEAVVRLIADRDRVGETLRRAATGDGAAAELVAACGVDLDDARRFLHERWLPHAIDVLALASPTIETPYLTTLRRLRAAAEPLPEDPFALGTLYAEALAVHQKSDGGIRSLSDWRALGKKGERRWSAAQEATAAELQAEMDGWADRADRADQAPTEHDRVLLDVLAGVGRVGTDAIARYRAGLDARGALDFAELQLKARALLLGADPAPLAALRARHRFVMVDEFQDTDQLQWDIVSALTRTPGGDAAPDRLFFVGDAKQAIYGFRGGDVEVFEGARQSVAPDDEAGRQCSLTINRRSRPELIAFFNGLFELALGSPAPGRPRWEAAYEPLAAGREVPGGTVRWLVCGAPAPKSDDGEGPEDSPGGVEAEARAVAALITRELLGGEGPYAALRLADPEAHPAPPIALLLRRRTKLPLWEAALREAGVPYLVLGGMGFWARPEVVDVVNLLVALTRRDAVARVAALRSPLFGLDDQVLADLAGADRLSRFGSGPPPEVEGAPASLTAAWESWASLERMRGHATAAEIIAFALATSRQRYQQAWLHPDGRSLANLDRLLAIADAHDQAGGTLGELAERLAGKVDAESREGEAPPPRSAARVVISTVHGSKGLEYPVVIVPELDARPAAPGGGGLLTSVGPQGWTLACPVPLVGGMHDEQARPGLYNTLRKGAAAREHAEYLRLFYVACTRARDHLVLVGPRVDGGRRPARWSDLVVDWVGSLESAPPWLQVDEPAIGALPAATESPVTPLPPPPADLAGRLAPLAAHMRLEVSPSSLALAATDLAGWRRRHLLGVPEVELPGTGAAGVNRARAAAVGQVVHELLEDEALHDEALARRRWVAAARGAALPPADLETGWADVQAQLAALTASPEVLALFDRRNYRELGVRLERAPLVVAGRMDLLCRDPVDGAWMVVDYKSQRLRESPADAAAAFRLQLLAYSVAASEVLTANGQPPVQRAALLFTRTATLYRLPDWTDADRADLDERLATLGAYARAHAGDSAPLAGG